MKTIIRTVLVAFFVCGGVLSVSAQTQEQRDYIARNTDLAAVGELQVRFDNEHQENYQKALELARQNGWPLTVNKPDGGFSELKGVTPDGRPMYNTTTNYGSAVTSRVNRIQPGGAAALNLDGTGMLVGVWDGGKPMTDHVDLVGRISNGDSSSATSQDHSTHVMGTIISSGVNKPLARGMAYNANAIWADWTNDMSEMAAAVKNKGLLISNHSYGAEGALVPLNFFGAYVRGSKSLDDLLFAAPFYQAVYSAGNDREEYLKYNPSKGGHDLLTDACVAKNVIAVAAVEEVLDYTSASGVKMSSFSNWGPTDDNRIKPDISDKGTNVYSTTQKSTTDYSYKSGTSMASPGVAGALLLIQQHYGNLNFPAFMRSATLRGLMAHTADEAGSASGPDSKFGWGLINAERAVKVISDSKAQKAIVSELILRQGATYTTTVLATGNEPLVATISWTDKSGAINETKNDKTTPVLINDLDIRITKDGVLSYPWKLAPIGDMETAAIKGDNKVDNIEKIEVENTVYGTYTITVTHKNDLIGNDVFPGITAQNFSLIVTGIGQQQLGVEQNDFKEFNVWPNPANELLNVSIQSDLSAEAFLTMYDILGRRVVKQKLNESNAMFEGSVNIDSLNPGIYLVKVTQDNKQSVRKIVKK